MRRGQKLVAVSAELISGRFNEAMIVLVLFATSVEALADDTIILIEGIPCFVMLFSDNVTVIL